MKICLTNAQMRSFDAATIAGGVPAEELMKRAGDAIAEEVIAVAENIKAKSILFVCGTGNNGGDGYVAANELLKRSYPVKVYAAEGRYSPDCLREKERYKGLYSQDICGDIVVDCLFGTGLNRKVKGAAEKIINTVNSSGGFIISADIPSGLNGDNGLIAGAAVRADLTVVIAQYKLGYFLNDGLDFCGKIVLKDIGIPASSRVFVAEKPDIKKFFPERLRNTHKGSYGSAYLAAGSEKYPGAAALSVSSCLRSGCGYVYAAVPDGIKYSLAARYPQCIYTERNCILQDEKLFSSGAVAIGMGMGCNKDTYQKVCTVIENYGGKLILDADALNALSAYGADVLLKAKCSVLLTPHIGEAARLLNKTIAEIISDLVGSASAISSKYGVCVHLKSSVCVTTDGEKSVLTAAGTTALAKAGSGDMLSGLICGSAARGLSLTEAAICSQYVLGTAAEICSKNLTSYCACAEDVINTLPAAVKSIIE